jgi:hypothetical protein
MVFDYTQKIYALYEKRLDKAIQVIPFAPKMLRTMYVQQDLWEADLPVTLGIYFE